MTWARDPPIRMVNASLNKLFRYHGGVKYKYMLNYHIKDMEWEKKKGLCNLFNSFWWWSHYIQCTSSNSSCLRLSTCPGLAAATTGRVEYKQQLSWPGQVNSLSSCLGWLVGDRSLLLLQCWLTLLLGGGVSFVSGREFNCYNNKIITRPDPLYFIILFLCKEKVTFCFFKGELLSFLVVKWTN